MWKRDLLEYRLLLCTRSELKDLGILCEARITKCERDKMELALGAQDMEILRRKAPEERSCILLIGTPFFGVETSAYVELQGDKATLTYEWRKMPSAERVSLLFPDALLYANEPIFLNKLRQRNLFSLEKWGLDKEDKARNDPTIQLLEACFGRRRLDAGGP